MSEPNYRLQGPAFERAVIAMFQQAMTGATIRRGRQAKGGGAAQADVVMPVLHVECKWRKHQNPREALAQAVSDADADMLPVAVILDDPDEGAAAEPFCVLRLSDLLTLMHSLWGLLGPARGSRWRAGDWRPPPLDVAALRLDLRRRQGLGPGVEAQEPGGAQGEEPGEG